MIEIPYDDFTETEKPDCELVFIGSEPLNGPVSDGKLQLFQGGDGQYYVLEEGREYYEPGRWHDYEKWLVSDDAAKIQEQVISMKGGEGR